MGVVTAVIAVLAFVLSLFNTWHKFRDDRAEQWWTRITWALEQTDSNSRKTRTVGWDVLTALVSDPPKRLHAGDQEMLNALHEWLRTVADDDRPRLKSEDPRSQEVNDDDLG